MHSLHQQQQQQHLFNLHLHRPTSPSLSALSFRSELVPLDRSINGDGTEIEPSVTEEMYEEEGGRIERLGGKVHLRGMAKMKNELLRQQFKETEPIRQREVELHNTRDLARQTTLVVRLLSLFSSFFLLSLPLCFHQTDLFPFPFAEQVPSSSTPRHNRSPRRLAHQSWDLGDEVQ
ncbi:hypothetical protein BDY24DRAFT_376666 [Mrakia frigida]|uniref:uncharacterized protein n=1 Tax=Mrakia frigida TaxID=29902 RepID=UPI003FCC0682